ncbi:unnamed protein product [Echinostoma caproni]|uniref:Ribos_L4_asso_C domain-containing protein n=1 Tax=Echinostoma caproni TaxID=27848 RepID=A0A183B9B7_9TREM|nr:unnamed protein product [Echinostoma caproni]
MQDACWTQKSDKKPGGVKIDEKLKMRTTVNLTRLDIEEAPHIFSLKKDKNLRFAPLVASTPDASFADITTDDPTIVGILNRKLLSPMKPLHAPVKVVKGPIKLPTIRPIAAVNRILGNPPPKAITSAHTSKQPKSYSSKTKNLRIILSAPKPERLASVVRLLLKRTPTQDCKKNKTHQTPLLFPVDRSHPPDRVKPLKTGKSILSVRNMNTKKMAALDLLKYIVCRW